MDIRYISTVGYDLFGGSKEFGGKGILSIEFGWSMCAIPVKFGFWDKASHSLVHDGVTRATIKNYVVDQIEDIYSVNAQSMIAVFNTLVGGQGNYWNFVPGVTNALSPHNFKLSYFDSDSQSDEVTGFFIKSIHPAEFEITWGDY